MMKQNESFHDELNSFREKFCRWKSFEQLYAIVELSKNLHISSQFFLWKFFENPNFYSNNEMFRHTVDEANSPIVVNCYRSLDNDRLPSTLQLFLPLLSHKPLNNDLIDAYEKTLQLFDSRLSTSQNVLINVCQQIYFFLQTNPNFGKIRAEMFSLKKLVEQNSSLNENILSDPIQQNLKPLDLKDSGIEIPESLSSNNSVVIRQNFSTQRIIQATSAPHRPLVAAQSVPISFDTNPRNFNRIHHQMQTTLPKSDEEEEDEYEQRQNGKHFYEFSTRTENDKIKNKFQNSNRTLQPFQSLRRKPTEPLQTNLDSVSQYLNIDSVPVKTKTFQFKSGMKDVPKWLKHLRLHKYTEHFVELTYEEMLSLTKEKLKARNITDGACSKILLNIRKLKERSETLKQTLNDFDRAQIDLGQLISYLTELLTTPIRGRNEDAEDLPSAILLALEKVYQNLSPQATPDFATSFVTLLDTAYRLEAFTDQHRHSILQWRGRVSLSLQSVNRNEFRSNLATNLTSSLSMRRSNKSSVRPTKSSSATYNGHHSTNSTSNGVDPMDSSSAKTDGIFLRANFKSSTTIDEKAENHFTQFNLRPIGSQSGTNNEHQKLSRKPSIHNPNEYSSTKTKLCKTSSEPFPGFSNEITMRQNPVQRVYLSNSNNNSSTSYRTNIMGPLVFPSKPNDRSNFFGSIENAERDSPDENHPSNVDFDSFCRELTASAMSDENILGETENSIHSSSSHSGDSEN